MDPLRTPPDPFRRQFLLEPLGPLSTALETLRGMLARSGNFQSLMGVVTPEAAWRKIFLASAPPAQEIADGDGSKEYTPAQWESLLRPFCLVYTAPTAGYRLTRESRYGFQDRGKLFVEIETNAPATADTNPEAADRVILNQIGQLAIGLANDAGQPGHLDIAEIALAAGPSRERFEEAGGVGKYYWTLLEVAYGPD
jgi:hypothetical protein